MASIAVSNRVNPTLAEVALNVYPVPYETEFGAVTPREVARAAKRRSVKMKDGRVLSRLPTGGV